MHYQVDTCRAKVFSWLLCSLTDLGDRKEEQKGCIKLFRNLKSIFQEDTGILRYFLIISVKSIFMLLLNPFQVNHYLKEMTLPEVKHGADKLQTTLFNIRVEVCGQQLVVTKEHLSVPRSMCFF